MIGRFKDLPDGSTVVVNAPQGSAFNGHIGTVKHTNVTGSVMVQLLDPVHPTHRVRVLPFGRGELDLVEAGKP